MIGRSGLAAYVRLVREVREGARGAIEARFDPPASSAKVHRFVHGFALPFSVARIVTRDPRARRRWLETLAIELAFLLPLGIGVALESDEVGEGLRDGWTAAAVATLAAMWAALGVVEWVLIAFA